MPFHVSLSSVPNVQARNGSTGASGPSTVPAQGHPWPASAYPSASKGTSSSRTAPGACSPVLEVTADQTSPPHPQYASPGRESPVKTSISRLPDPDPLSANWLCFRWQVRRDSLCNPLSKRHLASTGPAGNWLCFARPASAGAYDPGAPCYPIPQPCLPNWLCFARQPPCAR